VSPSALAGLVLEIPSPSTGVWWIGPIPIRGYALSILAGIVVAVVVAQRRIVARGGTAGQVLDISAWAIPFGIAGGRIYHLITTPQPYFGAGGNPWNAFRIWEGGLGIWGAVALGALGAWIGCRRHGVAFGDFADAVAPGYLIAQAMGRFGNWFNNEIYGPPTDLPWGLRIYEWDQQAGHAVLDSAGNPIIKGIFHPTFLYEALWCLGLAAFIVWFERRRTLRRGQAFALVVFGYPLGRFFIELMRTDDANRILGQRVNVWVSLLVMALGVYFYRRTGQSVPPAQAPTPLPPAEPVEGEPVHAEPVEAEPSGPDAESSPLSRHTE
jgi:prolipoprotein diacylglyceryl transferase